MQSCQYVTYIQSWQVDEDLVSGRVRVKVTGVEKRSSAVMSVCHSMYLNLSERKDSLVYIPPPPCLKIHAFNYLPLQHLLLPLIASLCKIGYFPAKRGHLSALE